MSKRRSSKSMNKPPFTKEEVEDFKTVFSIFDKNDRGLIDPQEVLNAMESENLERTTPELYNAIVSLNTNANKKKGGVDFDTLLDEICKNVGHRESPEGVRDIFNLFINNPKKEYITPEEITNVSRILGVSSRDNKSLIDLITKTGKDKINFEEFYMIMTEPEYVNHVDN